MLLNFNRLVVKHLPIIDVCVYVCVCDCFFCCFNKEVYEENLYNILYIYIWPSIRWHRPDSNKKNQSIKSDIIVFDRIFIISGYANGDIGGIGKRIKYLSTSYVTYDHIYGHTKICDNSDLRVLT